MKKTNNNYLLLKLKFFFHLNKNKSKKLKINSYNKFNLKLLELLPSRAKFTIILSSFFYIFFFCSLHLYLIYMENINDCKNIGIDIITFLSFSISKKHLIIFLFVLILLKTFIIFINKIFYSAIKPNITKFFIQIYKKQIYEITDKNFYIFQKDNLYIYIDKTTKILLSYINFIKNIILLLTILIIIPFVILMGFENKNIEPEINYFIYYCIVFFYILAQIIFYFILFKQINMLNFDVQEKKHNLVNKLDIFVNINKIYSIDNKFNNIKINSNFYYLYIKTYASSYKQKIFFINLFVAIAKMLICIPLFSIYHSNIINILDKNKNTKLSNCEYLNHKSCGLKHDYSQNDIDLKNYTEINNHIFKNFPDEKKKLEELTKFSRNEKAAAQHHEHDLAKNALYMHFLLSIVLILIELQETLEIANHDFLHLINISYINDKFSCLYRLLNNKYKFEDSINDIKKKKAEEKISIDNQNNNSLLILKNKKKQIVINLDLKNIIFLQGVNGIGKSSFFNIIKNFGFSYNNNSLYKKISKENTLLFFDKLNKTFNQFSPLFIEKKERKFWFFYNFLNYKINNKNIFNKFNKEIFYLNDGDRYFRNVNQILTILFEKDEIINKYSCFFTCNKDKNIIFSDGEFVIYSLINIFIMYGFLDYKSYKRFIFFDETLCCLHKSVFEKFLFIFRTIFKKNNIIVFIITHNSIDKTKIEKNTIFLEMNKNSIINKV